MESKVWVDGVVRVVCGLSSNTSCQDVVISLAQAIGQTGRYVSIRKFRGLERLSVAEDCPMQSSAQMGQSAAEVHFISRRTGPSLSEGPHEHTKQNPPPSVEPSETESHKGRQKALSFNLGPSTLPRRNKPSRNWSPTSGVSAEERASPRTVQDKDPSDPQKEEMFRQISEQQKMSHDSEAQIEASEKDTELWEQKVASSSAPDPTPDLTEDSQESEFRSKQYEVESMYGENWEEESKVESDREEEMHRRLQQIHSSIDDQGYEIKVLQSRSDHSEQDSHDRSRTNGQSPEEEAVRSTDEASKSSTQELHNRSQSGEDSDAALAETQWKSQTAEERVKDRVEMIDGSNKESRQCDSQQFIQQAGPNPYSDQGNPSPVKEVYRNKARVRK